MKQKVKRMIDYILYVENYIGDEERPLGVVADQVEIEADTLKKVINGERRLSEKEWGDVCVKLNIFPLYIKDTLFPYEPPSEKGIKTMEMALEKYADKNIEENQSEVKEYMESNEFRLKECFQWLIYLYAGKIKTGEYPYLKMYKEGRMYGNKNL